MRNNLMARSPMAAAAFMRRLVAALALTLFLAWPSPSRLAEPPQAPTSPTLGLAASPIPDVPGPLEPEHKLWVLAAGAVLALFGLAVLREWFREMADSER
jgi:hypothetical protein